MMKKTKRIALALALALLWTLLPFTAAGADTAPAGMGAADAGEMLPAGTAADGAMSDLMADIARQLQDPKRDPFAFETVPALRRGMRSGSNLPEAFDLRHVDTDGDGVEDACYVTPVKFQNPFGTCWGFAAIASAETSILSSGLALEQGFVYAVTPDTPEGLRELDLSEKHVSYFLMQPINDTDNPQNGEGCFFTGEDGDWNSYFNGGVPFYATGLFASGTGPVMEFGYVLDGDVWVQPFIYRGKEGNIIEKSGAPAYYAPGDDWSIKGEYRWYQNYVLKESFMLPTPSGKKGAEKTAAINAIKEQIYAGRAVQTGFCADIYSPWQETTPTAFISSNWAHYTYDPAAGANHAVAIIGWDDNYPAENFAHKTLTGEDAPLPKGNGAWLVKNSWGSEEEEFPNRGYADSPWGLLQGQDRGVYNEAEGKWEYNAVEGAIHTGYFWLSYEDESMMLLEALDFDDANTEAGYYLYQYDFMPVTEVDEAREPYLLRMANVFTADADGVVDRVSCQTTTPGTHVRYEVYLLDADTADPTDGLLVAAAEADYAYGGFHKASLDTPTLLREGQRFSVVVTQVTPAGKYCLSVQSSYKGNPGDIVQSRGVINPGESLFYLEEKAWYDLSVEENKIWLIGDILDYYDLDNFPIKAYLALPGGAEEGPAAPTAGNLTYTGQAQPLLTMPETLPAGYWKAQFSTDGGASWSDDVPTGTHAGTYTVLVKYVGGAGCEDFCEAPISVTIAPAPLTIRARNRSIIVGDPVPEWNADSYVVRGLMGDDALNTQPTVTYKKDGAATAVDTSRTGVYVIEPSGAAASADYAISYQNGKLTVGWPDYGGGEASPSKPIDWTPPEEHDPLRDAPGFADVDPAAWYAEAVSWAVAGEITTGTDATHFSPDLPCTRAQMVTFLWRAAGCPEPAVDTLAFIDVEPGSYYETAVRWAVAAGITTGMDETHFAPDLPVTRLQAVVFLFRFFGGGAGTSETAFVDVPAEAWYAEAVAWAAANGITEGVDETHFAPEDVCTRAQIVTFLYRCFANTALA